MHVKHSATFPGTYTDALKTFEMEQEDDLMDKVHPVSVQRLSLTALSNRMDTGGLPRHGQAPPDHDVPGVRAAGGAVREPSERAVRESR